MGAMIGQAVGGLLVSRLVSKLGGHQKSTPQVGLRASDLIPSTEAEKPQGMLVGGDDTTTKRGRKALTIQQNNTTNTQGYNPMNI